MDLDEAIKHCDEVAKRERKLYEEELTDCLEGCIKCAEEHEQLAEWLKELKRYRETDCLRQRYEKYADMRKGGAE